MALALILLLLFLLFGVGILGFIIKSFLALGILVAVILMFIFAVLFESQSHY